MRNIINKCNNWTIYINSIRFNKYGWIFIFEKVDYMNEYDFLNNSINSLGIYLNATRDLLNSI